MSIYLHEFENEQHILGSFEIEKESLDGFEVLLASYYIEGFNGSAFVLLKKDGQLFEVNGNHCSCFDLEGQWELEETSKEALLHRMEKGRLFWPEGMTDELLKILKEL
jgi:hypothetical protein